MTRIIFTLLVACLGFGGATSLTAQDFAVIANEAVPATSIGVDELGRVFQKRTTRWGNGLVAEPVDQGEQAAVRARFSQHVFSRSVEQMKTFWQTQIFSGRGVPPVEMADDQQVIAFVQGHAGAIGYVAAGAALPAGVKRLRVTGR